MLSEGGINSTHLETTWSRMLLQQLEWRKFPLSTGKLYAWSGINATKAVSIFQNLNILLFEMAETYHQRM